MKDIGVELNKIENMDCYEYINLIKDKSIDTVISDVPYNIGEDSEDDDGNTIKKINSKNMRIKQDFGDWDKGEFIVQDWIRAVLPKIKDNGQIIIFNSFKNVSKMADTLYEEGWFIKGMFDWVKPNPMPNAPNRFPLNSFELYIWAVKDPDDYTFNVREQARTQRRVEDGKVIPSKPAIYEVGRMEASAQEDRKNRFHTTQKPVSMWQTLVEKHSNIDDIVLDSFSGSGVNAIACINANRNFIGSELDKKYFDLANERIEKKLRYTPPKF